MRGFKDDTVNRLIISIFCCILGLSIVKVQGTPRALKPVAASAEYYPYGEPWTEPAGGSDRWFGGKERLSSEGLAMSDFGPRLLGHAYPAWHCQDRKLESYYPLSPYAFCSGNPVRYVDPLGEDHYVFNENGEFIKRMPEKEFDRVVVVDAKGVEKKSKPFDYGTIESVATVTKQGGTIDIMKVRGDKNGTKVFELLADNTKIEYSHIQCGEEGSTGLNYISTSHSKKNDVSQDKLIKGQLQYGYTVRTISHNHPSNSLNASPADVVTAQIIKRIFPHQLIIFKVYTTEKDDKNRNYITY